MDAYEEKDKKAGSNADKESPQKKGFNCLENLPEEMWSELLGKLDDVSTLLSFRSVSPELKILSEEKLADLASKSFISRSYFGYVEDSHPPFADDDEDLRRKDSYIFVRCRRQSYIRITDPEQAQTVIASKNIATVGSHIPTGCVVFYTRDWNALPFYNCLEPLVNTFLEDITSLIYQPHPTLDTAQFVIQLSLIFKLKNLRQLFIYYSHHPRKLSEFKLDMLNKFFQGAIKIHVNPGLKYLHLREFPPNKVGILPLITVFKNILPDCNNGCVLFYPDEGLTYLLAFYNSLQTLVNTFPDAISTFVYQPHFSLDTTQFLLQLSLIFQLKNLKRLFIYYSHEPNQPQKFELGTLNKAFKSFNIKTTHTNRLQNLHLREYPPNNDKSPLITLFKNFLPEWKNLEYLNFNWNSSIDMGEITRQMMEHPPPRKLEQLELQDPSQQLLEYFCVDSVDKEVLRPAKYSPRYKEIHIHFNNGGNRFATQVQGYSKEESNLIQLFNTLDANQTDLETLTLGLYLPPNFQRRPGTLPLNFAVKFTKLKELHFNYLILLRWESLLEVLNEKLPNVERITVESSYECMKIFNESNVKIVGVYHTVRNLWNVFPSLKTIRVLYYQWTLEKGGKDPENVTRVAKRL